MKHIDYLLIALLCLIFCFVLIYDAFAQVVPENSKKYCPMLRETVNQFWAEYDTPWDFAGQIEQETCISLTHKKCWNPTAELKTKREYGFGLGQVTIAYNADGTERFNNFNDVRKYDSVLAQWEWEDRYNPALQMRALIRKDLVIWKQFDAVFGEQEHKAVMFAAYNGGVGGVMKDRRICLATEGCDADKWFDNVELYSYKAKKPVSGYGKSFFEINREYVRNILFERNKKYAQFFNCSRCHI